MGVIFSVLMTLICVCTFVAMMQEGYYLKDKFYRYLVTGVGIAYIFQTFLTIGGGTKFIPLTGVTLPFVSYGGTSILTTMIMIMIAEGVSMIRVDERYVAIENKRKKLEARRRAEEQNQVTGIK